MNTDSIQGWSEDIRITFGGESGGIGLFIHMFHIDQIGNYYFIGYNRGNEFTFLTKNDETGTLLIDEKNLLSEQPLHAFFDESQTDIYIFHRFESRDEIGYSKYDENGEKIIDSNIISDIDLWILYNPIATIDKDKNIVIFWFIPNFCHKCYFDSSYATIFHCCFRLFFPERTFEKKMISLEVSSQFSLLY